MCAHGVNFGVVRETCVGGRPKRPARYARLQLPSPGVYETFEMLKLLIDMCFNNHTCGVFVGIELKELQRLLSSASCPKRAKHVEIESRPARALMLGFVPQARTKPLRG